MEKTAVDEFMTFVEQVEPRLRISLIARFGAQRGRALAPALEDLSTMQRMAVVLVHAYGWTHAEAAVVMEVAEPTVKTHVQRALAKLRSVLEVESDA